MVSSLTRLPGFSFLISTIINQKVTHNHTHMRDIFKGLLTFLSLFLFSYNPNSNDSHSSKAVHIGYILLVISLICDGLISLKQKLIKTQIEEHPSLCEYKDMLSWYFMLILNLFNMFIMGSLCCKKYFNLSV